MNTVETSSEQSRPTTSKNDSGIEVKKLGALPIIGHFLNRLGVREIIDGHTPKPGSEVTNGECIEALLMAIFLDKEHAFEVSWKSWTPKFR